MDNSLSINTRISFSHFSALDGLRGIAVLTVMAYHLEFLIPDLHMLVKGGFLGVDIFFVLSGFLITSILLKEYDQTGQINLVSFYLKRTLRLVPAFWIFLIILYLCGNILLPPIQAHIIYDNYNFAFSFFYLLNWHRAAEGLTGNLNHTWSLAIEEQFYVIWSLVLFFAFRESRSRKQIFVGTAVAIALLMIFRAVRTMNGTSIDTLYYSTDTRIDAILIGCLASMAYCWHLIPAYLLRPVLFDRVFLMAAIGSLAILFTVSHEDRFFYYGLNSLFCSFVAIGILWLVCRENTLVHSLFQNRLLCWLGKISYGLYLWHYLFYEFAKYYFTDPAAQIIVGFGLSLVISSVSFYLFEQPILKIKDKLLAIQTPKSNLTQHSPT